MAEASPDQYQSLTQSLDQYYYLSIPDINHLRIGNIIQEKRLGIYGNINLYQANFVKESPINFTGVFTDNFIKLDYLRHASNWQHVMVTFFDFIQLKDKFASDYQPLYLIPTSSPDAFITYKFKLTKKYPDLYLKLGYLNKNPNSNIQVEINSPSLSKNLTKTVFEKRHQDFSEKIFDLSEFVDDEVIDITFRLTSQSTNFDQLGLAMKYFSLYTTSELGTSYTELSGSYEFNAQLESDQKNNWLTDSYQNFGWYQTDSGTIYKAFDDSNPLIYEFNLPPGMTEAKITVKTYTLRNGLTLELSNNNQEYLSLANIYDERQYLTHEYQIDPKFIKNQRKLYLKVDALETNPQAILRYLHFIVK